MSFPDVFRRRIPRPEAITWTFVMSPTISNTGHRLRRARPTSRARPSQMALEANFDFLRSPRGVRQGLADVLGFQVGILAKNFVARAACRDQSDDGSDRNPHPANARLPA